MRYALGVDIGGTGCALVLGHRTAEGLVVDSRDEFPTAQAARPSEALERLAHLADQSLSRAGLGRTDIAAIGISCGGPLDTASGTILSPPNLPGWDEVPVVTFFRERFGVPARLQNDANASALAEWRYGAGRGLRSLVFLTFGTGLGAGLILDGRLYEGADSLAGEVGHLRLSRFGPVGYGKAGSFEGFCSGGGIAQLARNAALERFQRGLPVGYCDSPAGLGDVDARRVAEAARAGDELAAEVYRTSGEFLGRGLALVIDLLNPEAVILGGIFPRCESLLRPAMEASLEAECLARSRTRCRILPAALGEAIGDYAALSLAFQDLPEAQP